MNQCPGLELWLGVGIFFLELSSSSLQSHHKIYSHISKKEQRMSDVYYIVVTVIFGVFVLVMALWIWRFMRASNPLELTHEELSDDQKAMIYKFCGEMRRAREAKEREAPRREMPGREATTPTAAPGLQSTTSRLKRRAKAPARSERT